MTKKAADEGRRDFLKLATVAAPAAAVTAIAPKAAEAATEAAREGLRMTEHVKKYLESARF